MNPFQQKKESLENLANLTARKAPEAEASAKPDVTCKGCEGILRHTDLKGNQYVCPLCGYHFNVPAKYRIKSIADPGTFKELNAPMRGTDLLNFPGYLQKLHEARKKSGLQEAVITGSCKIGEIKVVLCVMDNRFFMGSMGSAVGEKITAAFEYATKKKRPIVIFTTSGGARMQEGIISLFQMAKTSAAAAKHDAAGQLYISVMTHPTTGGVTASFASLADITLAEPGALIGFAGPRVIEQTIKQSLPEGFQRAEYLEEHGFVDMVVPRQNLRDTLSKLLYMHQRRG